MLGLLQGPNLVRVVRRRLTLFVVVDETHFSGIGLGLGDGDGCRVGHSGHRWGWHHQCRHDVIIKRLRPNFAVLTFACGKKKLATDVVSETLSFKTTKIFFSPEKFTAGRIDSKFFYLVPIRRR